MQIIMKRIENPDISSLSTKYTLNVSQKNLNFLRGFFFFFSPAKGHQLKFGTLTEGFMLSFRLGFII